MVRRNGLPAAWEVKAMTKLRKWVEGRGRGRTHHASRWRNLFVVKGPPRPNMGLSVFVGDRSFGWF